MAWHVEGEDQFAKVVSDEGWTVFESSHIHDGNLDVAEEIHLSHMRLGAAAPDLLAACKVLVANHEAMRAAMKVGGLLYEPDPDGPYMLAKSAVEKAEPGWIPPDDEPDEDDTAIYTETGGEG